MNVKSVGMLIALSWLFGGQSVLAAEYSANVTDFTKLKTLSISDQVEVNMKGKRRPVATVRGELGNSKWSVEYRKETILEAGSDNREFEFEVPLKSQTTEAKIYIRNSKGKTKKITVEIDFPDFETATEGGGGSSREEDDDRYVMGRKKKNSFFWIAAGGAIVNYEEVGDLNAKVSFMAIQAQLGFDYLFAKSRWGIHGSGAINALPLNTEVTGTNVSGTTIDPDGEARFLGGDLRLSYGIPFNQEKGWVRFYAGLAFDTMLVSATDGNEFGFSGLVSILAYPAFVYQVSSDNSIELSMRYAPIIGLDLADRIFTVGGAFIHQFRSGKALRLGVDYRDISFLLPADPTDSTTSDNVVNSTNIIFTVGFGF